MDSSLSSPDEETNQFEVVSNVDQTPLFFDIVPGRVLDKKGKRNQERHLAVVLTVFADGVVLPALAIFKGMKRPRFHQVGGFHPSSGESLDGRSNDTGMDRLSLGASHSRTTSTTNSQLFLSTYHADYQAAVEGDEHSASGNPRGLHKQGTAPGCESQQAVE